MVALDNELLARALVNLNADTIDEIAANLAAMQKELMADDIKHESADSSDPQPDPNAGPISQPAALARPHTHRARKCRRRLWEPAGAAQPHS